MGQQPPLDDRGLVRGQVVADDVDVQAGLDLAVDVVEEVAEVDGPVLGGQLADDFAGRGVQSGEQVDRAVPDVVKAAPLGDPGIIRSTAAVRARAWICGFSSTAKTPHWPAARGTGRRRRGSCR